MIEHYINPVLGNMPLRSVRAEHLDHLYRDLLATGGVKQSGLAPKTVYDVHVVTRTAFTKASRQHLVTTNPALAAEPPRSRIRQRSGPECWTAEQLAESLDATQHLRLHPESLYQLFSRQVRRLDLPRICFHGLRHTHATLLVADGTSIKVVSERLGHANPGFTMATYQHVLPGMGSDAAKRFGQLVAAAR